MGFWEDFAEGFAPYAGHIGQQLGRGAAFGAGLETPEEAKERQERERLEAAEAEEKTRQIRQREAEAKFLRRVPGMADLLGQEPPEIARAGAVTPAGIEAIERGEVPEAEAIPRALQGTFLAEALKRGRPAGAAPIKTEMDLARALAGPQATAEQVGAEYKGIKRERATQETIARETAKLTIPYRLSERERRDTGDAAKVSATAQLVLDTHQPGYTGMGQGAYGYLQEKLGWQTPEQAQFYQALEQMARVVRRADFGAALTGTELEIAKRSVPHRMMSDSQFVASVTMTKAIQDWHLGLIENREGVPQGELGEADAQYRLANPFPGGAPQAATVPGEATELENQFESKYGL